MSDPQPSEPRSEYVEVTAQDGTVYEVRRAQPSEPEPTGQRYMHAEGVMAESDLAVSPDPVAPSPLRVPSWSPPSKERLAEWWVLLNCWEWPADLPHHPDAGYGHNLREQVSGAHTMLEAVGIDFDDPLVTEAWARYKEIIEANRG